MIIKHDMHGNTYQDAYFQNTNVKIVLQDKSIHILISNINIEYVKFSEHTTDESVAFAKLLGVGG